MWLNLVLRQPLYYYILAGGGFKDFLQMYRTDSYFQWELCLLIYFGYEYFGTIVCLLIC